MLDIEVIEPEELTPMPNDLPSLLRFAVDDLEERMKHPNFHANAATWIHLDANEGGEEQCYACLAGCALMATGRKFSRLEEHKYAEWYPDDDNADADTLAKMNVLNCCRGGFLAIALDDMPVTSPRNFTAESALDIKYRTNVRTMEDEEFIPWIRAMADDIEKLGYTYGDDYSIRN